VTTFVLAFVASGLVVVVAGSAMARYADAIAEITKIGRLWIGSVLLAGATSLPELTTDVAAVRLGATDLAVGDLFGSSMANMLILAVIDLWPVRGRVLRAAALDHALAASLAIALNALAAVMVLSGSTFSILRVSPASVLLALAYVAGVRAVYRNTVPAQDTPAPALPPASASVDGRPTLRRAVLGFAAGALAILVAAPAFAWSAKGIAESTGIGHTIAGTYLVGLATSLPELVTCVAAVRLGAFDMAVGNLFGSNAFNMAIFLAIDVAQPGSIFASLDPQHAVSGLFGVVLMGLGLAAIAFRAKRRFAMIEPDSVLILVSYVAALWLLISHVKK